MRQTPLIYAFVLSCVLYTVIGFLFLSYGPNLGRYNVDQKAVSVSGISSGAAMAIQYHVALSRDVMGVGVMAGAPYGCAGPAGQVGALQCMSHPSLIVPSALAATAKAADSVGTIDDVSNLHNDRVFVFHGSLDTVVKPAAGPKIVEFYHSFMPLTNIATNFQLQAVHGVPTMNYGNPCNKMGASYLNKCDYSAAFHILNHIYGGHLKEPSTSTQLQGKLLKFDQSDFFYLSPPSTYSMDNVGYVYVPSACENGQTKCKLHIAFHGCSQGIKFVGEDFVRHAGYNEVGELNNIIILYPQVISIPSNPMGCWDWWGYTGIYYGVKDGFQITAVRRMMERVMGK